jgi:uncharacterized OB-fold protein
MGVDVERGHTGGISAGPLCWPAAGVPTVAARRDGITIGGKWRLTVPDVRSSASTAPEPVRDLRPVDVVADEEPDRPALRGSRCPSCGRHAFPPRAVCQHCLHGGLDDVSLGGVGTVYAFTTVHVSSSREVPYVLAFVDLPAEVRVLTRLAGPADELAIGDTVRLTRLPDDWAFAKATGGAG